MRVVKLRYLGRQGGLAIGVVAVVPSCQRDRSGGAGTVALLPGSWARSWGRVSSSCAAPAVL
jgi:hypothetical protein